MNNPKRGAIPQYLQGKYQPEHVRLELEPSQPNVNPNNPNVAVRTFKVSGTQKRTLSPKHTVPVGRTLPVQVGNNEEQMWTDGLEQMWTDGLVASPNAANRQIKIAPDEYIDNNDYVDVEAQQTRQNSYEEFPEEQTYQAPSPPKGSDQAESIIKALNLTLSPGEYIVFCQERVVVRTTEEHTIKESIEKLILNNIPIEDIFVCKRLNINFGVLLDG